MKKKVLVLAGYYIPSVKGGGPVQSITNLVDNLSDQLEFYILCSDRDLGDKQSYAGIKTDQWLTVGKAQVYYANPSELSVKLIKQIAASVDWDVLYLNSLFSYKFSVLPLILWKFRKSNGKKIVLAPRGELSAGALSLKKGKKKCFIYITSLLGLYDDIVWHATSGLEKDNIMAVHGQAANIAVVNNLPGKCNSSFVKQVQKNSGEIKLIFVSRIHPKKNLKEAIQYLRFIIGKVEFNIYGPIEDEKYWHLCKATIRTLPPNITVRYKGLLLHEEVIQVFTEHHVFLFPTLGENYGHVIFEALAGGCPVIISDQTPWRSLDELNIGFDINLSNVEGYIEAIQFFTDMGNEQYDNISRRAHQYSLTKSMTQGDIVGYRKMLS